MQRNTDKNYHIFIGPKLSMPGDNGNLFKILKVKKKKKSQLRILLHPVNITFMNKGDKTAITIKNEILRSIY